MNKEDETQYRNTTMNGAYNVDYKNDCRHTNNPQYKGSRIEGMNQDRGYQKLTNKRAATIQTTSHR